MNRIYKVGWDLEMILNLEAIANAVDLVHPCGSVRSTDTSSTFHLLHPNATKPPVLCTIKHTGTYLLHECILIEGVYNEHVMYTKEFRLKWVAFSDMLPIFTLAARVLQHIACIVPPFAYEDVWVSRCCDRFWSPTKLVTCMLVLAFHTHYVDDIVATRTAADAHSATFRLERPKKPEGYFRFDYKQTSLQTTVHWPGGTCDTFAVEYPSSLTYETVGTPSFWWKCDSRDQICTVAKMLYRELMVHLTKCR